MEEQQLPVHKESVIVASNKKHSWSKKERLALYIAGVFALVGIGFGGYTFYNQVILNAAGEDSLGSDVSVDLPQPNESAYFTVKNAIEQDIFITVKGDAAMANQVNSNYQNGDLAPGWRIEQTETPLDDASWKVVAQSKMTRNSEFHDQFQSTTNETDYPSHIALSSNLSDRSLYTNIPYTTLSDTELKDTKFLQPERTYYFRITKESDADGTQWAQQGNYVQVSTKAYNDYGFSVTNTTGTTALKFAWNGSSVQQSSLPNGVSASNLLIAKVKNVNDLYSHTTLDSDQQWDSSDNASLYIPGEDIQPSWYNSEKITAGTREATQAKDTVYYYALVAANGTTIGKVLSEPVPVSTFAATTKPLVSATLSPATLAADKANTLSVKVNNSDTSTGTYGEDVSFSLIGENGKLAGDLCYSASYGITDPITSVNYDPSKCKNVLPGSYSLRTLFTRSQPFPVLSQTIDSAVTFTKVDPNITATYKDASINYKKDVVINLKYTANSQFYNEAAYAKGTFKIVNLNTRKTIKTFSWNTYTGGIQTKITLKGVKKGTYNLAIVYNADMQQGVYQDKTINLPKLTVKPNITGSGSAKSPTKLQYSTVTKLESCSSEQAFASDGTYLYATCAKSSKKSKSSESSSRPTQIRKLTLSGSEVQRSDTYYEDVVGHANDATYNTKTGTLILNGWDEGNNDTKKLLLFNPNTLKLQKTASFKKGPGGDGLGGGNICYNPGKDQYFSMSRGGGSNDGGYIYDSNFMMLKKLVKKQQMVKDIGQQMGTGQGVECTQSYIYIVNSPTGWATSRILVYDWNAKVVGVYEVKGELENVTVTNGTLYGIINSTDTIIEITNVPV